MRLSVAVGAAAGGLHFDKLHYIDAVLSLETDQLKRNVSDLSRLLYVVIKV